ncbi:MAG: glycosyltransferase family 1 protein, partial [Gammaproteobacteria bacterium]
ILRYDILELATAVKPRCMKRLFEEGAEYVFYIDPDIVFFRPLEEALGMLGEGAMGVLTPHLLAPLPRDGALPDDRYILRSGVYNLGFLALSAGEESEALLDWWWGWLKTDCYRDPCKGVFVDQKWMDFAPVFWPQMGILRDETYNVAYWNLPQRDIERRGEVWYVNGRPMTFFHFSGFDPERPGILSKHQNRITIKPWMDLARLLKWYADTLKAHDYPTYARMPVLLPRFDNGVPVDPVVRRLFQEALEQGVSFADPLSTQGNGSFLEWLNERSPRDVSREGPPITRYLEQLYHMRSDVMRVYPDLFGEHRQGFIHWLFNTGRKEHDIHEAFLRPLDASPAPAPSYPGFNVASYLRTESGIGEAARGYVRALQRLRVPLVLNDVSDLAEVYRSEDESLNAPFAYDNPHPVNLICVNADQVPVFLQRMGEAYFKNRYNIGLWAWETPDFPEAWRDRFAYFDEIWVASDFEAEAIGLVSPIPVIKVPHVVEVPEVKGEKADFGLEGEFLFLFMYDFHSIAARKNPEAVIEAFSRAFHPDEPARLVLKSVNGEHHPEAMRALMGRAGDARITVMDRYLSALDRFKLMAACDAYVSLHRAEGFGLTIAEAMALGKPVIATDWSGNRDFMHVHNAFPVAYRLIRLEKAEGPYPEGTLWADPDIEDAAAKMRRVFDHPEEAKALGERAREAIRNSLSAEAVAQRIASRMEVIKQHIVKPGELPVEAVTDWRQRLRRTWHWGLGKAPPVVQPFLRRQGRRAKKLLKI